MATKKISELNALTTPESDDLIAIVDASATETKKITYGNISKHIVNVGTEVEEDSRINFIKSKNLFDKNNVNKLVGYFNEGTPTITSNEFNRTLYLPCDGNTTYTITIPDGTGAYAIGYTTTTPTIGSSVSGVSNNNKTITTGANAKYLVMRYFQTNNATITEQQAFDGIQVEYGETATSYEPYVTKSIVVDNTTFTETTGIGTSVDSSKRLNLIHSRNLFDANTMIELTNQVRRFSDGVIVNVSNFYGIKVPVKPNTTYIISSNLTRDAISNLCYFDGNTYLSGVAFSSGELSFTTPNNCNYITLAIRIGYTWFQLEEGTTATPYKPFATNEINIDNEKYTDTINVGTSIDGRSRVNVLKSKNLFDGKLELGGYDNSGVKVNATNNYRNVNIIPVKPNTTYTFSINGVSQKYVLYFYNVDHTFISQNSSLTTGTFTTPNNTYFVNFRTFLADFVSDFANLKVQLELGSTATSYEEFIPNQIVVDNEKYTDTINVGTNVDSRSRVNVLYSNTQISTGNLEQGGFTNTGLPQNNPTRVRSASFIATKPNTSYSVKIPSTMKVVVRFYSTNTPTSESLGETTGWVNEQRTFTTPSNGNYIKLLIGKQNDANITPSEVTFVELKGYVTPSINVDGEEIYSKPVVLWENSSPGSTFDAQTITLKDNIENYSYYEVLFRISTGAAHYRSIKAQVGKLARMESFLIGKSYYRIVNSMSGTSMSFTKAFEYTTYGSDTTAQTIYTIIPYQVIGYK